MATPEIILNLERALKAYCTATQHLPDGFVIVCAHEAEKISDSVIDYLVIQAGRPSYAELGEGNATVLVEFQVYTGAIIDEDERAEAVAVHDANVAALEWIWGEENFAAALAALNAPIVAGITFTGWEPPDDAPGEDGNNGAQLIAKLRYAFECHRA